MKGEDIYYLLTRVLSNLYPGFSQTHMDVLNSMENIIESVAGKVLEELADIDFFKGYEYKTLTTKTDDTNYYMAKLKNANFDFPVDVESYGRIFILPNDKKIKAVDFRRQYKGAFHGNTCPDVIAATIIAKKIIDQLGEIKSGE
jgi:hypothetical protein